MRVRAAGCARTSLWVCAYGPRACRTYVRASGVPYVPPRTVWRTAGSGAFNEPLSRNDPFVRLLHQIRTCTVPVLAAVEGGVWGGACDLVACCDVVVGTPPWPSPNPKPNPDSNAKPSPHPSPLTPSPSPSPSPTPTPTSSPNPNSNPSPGPHQVGTPEVSFAITPAKVTP